MGEGRAGDGLIKLFGKTIPVPETPAAGDAAKVGLGFSSPSSQHLSAFPSKPHV